MKSVCKLFYFYFVYFIVYSLFFIVNAPSAHAAPVSLTVDKPIIQETIKPGETSSFILELKNSGEIPVSIEARLAAIERITDEGYPVLTDKPVLRAAKDWLALPKNLPTIGPQEKATVEITANPPQDTLPGGYNAALILEAHPPKNLVSKESGALVIGAISASLLLNVTADSPPTIKDLTTVEFSTPGVVVRGPVVVRARFKNPSKFFIPLEGRLTVKSLFGARTTIRQFNQAIVFPESERAFVAGYAGKINPELYTASLELLQGEARKHETARFLALPYWFLGTLATLVLAVALYLVRRRLARAARALRNR